MCNMGMKFKQRGCLRAAPWEMPEVYDFLVAYGTHFHNSNVCATFCTWGEGYDRSHDLNVSILKGIQASRSQPRPWRWPCGCSLALFTGFASVLGDSSLVALVKDGLCKWPASPHSSWLKAGLVYALTHLRQTFHFECCLAPWNCSVLH